MCIQKNLFIYEPYDVLLGDEDCLYINVYTPKVIGSNKIKNHSYNTSKIELI